jgi:hypothetical protein
MVWWHDDSVCIPFGLDYSVGWLEVVDERMKNDIADADIPIQ